MTIQASHTTMGAFQAVAELTNDGSETSLLFAWGASLTDDGATFEFASGNLNDCAAQTTTGSCSSLIFEGVFTSLDDLEDIDPTSAVSSSSLELVDGDNDFTGTLTLASNDLSTNRTGEAICCKCLQQNTSLIL